MVLIIKVISILRIVLLLILVLFLLLTLILLSIKLKAVLIRLAINFRGNLYSCMLYIYILLLRQNV